MNDYKEMIGKLRMAGRWIKHDDGSEETYLLSVNDCAEAADAIEQLVRERDFMYDYIPRQCNTCGNYVCTVDSFGINSYGCDKGGCVDWKRKENWEWRGVQE